MNFDTISIVFLLIDLVFAFIFTVDDLLFYFN